MNGVIETMKLDVFMEKMGGFLPKLLFALAFFLIGRLISNVVVNIMDKALGKSKLDKTANGFLKSLVHITLYTFVVIIALTMIGVPTTSIVAVVGAAGLAVGLALQNSLSNLAGGFIILFSRPFGVGDFIESSGTSGTVQGITILYTRLLTVDNKAVYIPNGQISSNKLINYNQESLRRLDLTFNISYNDDFEVAKDIINGVLIGNDKALQEPLPIVRVVSHEGSSIAIAVKVWVSATEYWNLHYDVLEQVKTKFDEHGITIPFNQLDVNIGRNE